MAGDIVKRLDIKAGVMEMGEKIAWGSDTSLMREAARYIEQLESEVERWKQVAEDAALAQTKKEACEIVEKALDA